MSRVPARPIYSLYDQAIGVRLIWLHDNTRIVVDPIERYQQALKQLAWNTGWTGAPIFVLTSNYGMDLPLFMMAMERYLADPAARAELARRQLPNMPAKPSNA